MREHFFDFLDEGDLRGLFALSLLTEQDSEDDCEEEACICIVTRLLSKDLINSLHSSTLIGIEVVLYCRELTSCTVVANLLFGSSPTYTVVFLEISK